MTNFVWTFIWMSCIAVVFFCCFLPRAWIISLSKCAATCTLVKQQSLMIYHFLGPDKREQFFRCQNRFQTQFLLDITLIWQVSWTSKLRFNIDFDDGKNRYCIVKWSRPEFLRFDTPYLVYEEACDDLGPAPCHMRSVVLRSCFHERSLWRIGVAGGYRFTCVNDFMLIIPILRNFSNDFLISLQVSQWFAYLRIFRSASKHSTTSRVSLMTDTAWLNEANSVSSRSFTWHRYSRKIFKESRLANYNFTAP